MGVKFVSVKCPDCGANLDFEADRKQGFCNYCGAKIFIQNENEYIYRHVDEAQIKQAETEWMVRLKQIELVEKKREDIKKAKALKIKNSLIMFLMGIFIIAFGFMVGDAFGGPGSWFYMLPWIGIFLIIGAGFLFFNAHDNEMDDDIDFSDKIKVPSSIYDYEKMSYSVIESIFIGAGFTNVKSVGLNDLTFGVLKKPGMVESITINGSQVIFGGKKYPKDASVVITYHSINR